MAVDWNDLSSKRNDYDGPKGKLTAEEWNDFVIAVENHKDAINDLSSSKIEGIRFNGQAYTDIVNVVNSDGKTFRCIDVPADESARTVKFIWIPEESEPNNITIAGNVSIPLSFQMYDVDVDGNPFGPKGMINIYVDDVRVHSITNIGNGDIVNIDLMKVSSGRLSSVGSHLVVIEYNNSNKIESKYISVNTISLSLDIDNFSNFYTPSTTSWPIAYLTTGSTLHYVIKNANAADITGSEVATYSSMSLENILKLSKHGVNNITVWNSIEIDGTSIKTDEQHFKYSYVANENEVIIMSNVLNGDSFDLYNNISIGFTAYIPGLASGEKIINVGLYNNDALIFDEKSVSVNVVGNLGSGSVSFSLVPDSNFDKDAILGINTIKISVDNYIDITNIKINKVEISYHEVPNYNVFFNADNKSNADANSHEWVSTGIDKPISMEFNNVPFIDGASGWNEDPINGTSLKLKRGSYCTLNYQPFLTNPAYYNGNNSGLTVSIEFATSNCFKDNAPVVKCIDPKTGHGFEITASTAMLKSSNKTLRAKFKEDTRLRLDFVIEGTLTTYNQKSWVPVDPDKPSKGQKPMTADSSEAMMLIYIDGVYVGLAEYGTMGGTDFRQQVPQNIVFGSDLCDLDIYKIRIYKNALNCIEIDDNYAYDAHGVANKTAIALRNKIFGDAQGKKRNKPDIDLNALRKARPNLPIFNVRLDDKHHNDSIDPALRGELTNNKNDWQLCSFSEFDNPLLKVRDEKIALNSWQANTGTIRNQGTSSMGYPWPWRNWDWKTGDSEHGTDKDDMKFYFPTLDSDVSASKWPQYQYKWEVKTPSMKKLTLKKDYASSEMCNNAICSELFTDFATMLATGKSTYVDTLLTPAMADEWKKTNENGNPRNSTDFRLSLKAKPCFMIQELSYDSKGGDPVMKQGTAGLGKDALGMMNLIPNKNEVYYLGFKQNRWEDNDWVEKNGEVWIKTTNDDGEEIKIVEDREQAWELRENKDEVYWRYHIDPAHVDSTTGKFVNEIFDHYEARTPKDSPIFNKDMGCEEDFDFGDYDPSTFDADKHLRAMEDQTKDICRLHNWFVDTNRELATGKKIKDLYDASTWDALQRDYGYSNEWLERYDLRNSGPDADGNSYESWRLLRFKTEAKSYLIEKQWMLYYLWRELFWMFDSGFKNLQVYTLDGTHWGTMVRDADTALGIENTGKDYFAPHLEDTDGYKIVDGVTQYGYGVAKDLYYSGELTEKGYGAVLNGQFGSVWVNIRDAWKDDIAAMFRDLTSASVGGVTTEFVTNKFRNHQENWCEALYNFGMRQYFAGDAYLNNISAGLGDKKHSRAQWLERAMYYRLSKYKAFDENDYMYCRRGKQKPLWVSFDGNDNDKTQLSSDEQTKVTFKSYIPTYIWCGGDQNAANKPFRLIDINNDKEYAAVVDVASADGMNLPDHGVDGNTAIYGMRYITDMGELFKYCALTSNPQTLNMPMLRNLEFGHDSRRDKKKYWTKTNGVYKELENNDNDVATINLSLMKGLTLLDMTNHRSLNTISGLDKCTQLEAVYISGTNVNTLNLPQTSTIKKLFLNDKLSNITFDNLINLEDVRIDGYNNISSVYITNCNEYMQSKSAEIITNCIDKLVDAYDPNGSVNCTLTNINWSSFGNNNIGTRDYEILEKLVDINAVLKGTINVSNMPSSLKIKLINKYGNIDDDTNALYVTYPQVSVYGLKLKYNKYWLEPNNEMLDLSKHLVFNADKPAYSNPNTMISTSWSLESGYEQYVKIDNNGVITRLDKEYESDKPIVITCTVTQKVDPNDVMVTATVTNEQPCVLYLCKHIAKPGDVIYPDGSFSDAYVKEDNPIGVCYYVDESNPDNRLMFALNTVTQSKAYSWGLGHYYSGNYPTDTDISSNTYYSPHIDESVINDIAIYTNVESGAPSLYDINGITAYKTVINGMIDRTPIIKTPNYVYTGADGQLYFNNDHDKSYAVSEIGFKKINKNLETYESYEKYNSNTKLVIANANDNVPVGLYNTIKIINTRNAALCHPDVSKLFAPAIDGGITNIIPHNNSVISENTMLTNNIQSIKNIIVPNNSEDKDKYKNENISDGAMDFYYPAASMCWAYNPCNNNKSIINIDPKFTEHNWFLPAAGDGVRISYFINAVVKNEFDNLSDAFRKYRENSDALMAFNALSLEFASSTEQEFDAYTIRAIKCGIGVHGGTGGYVNMKSSNIYALPICKF